MLKRILVGLNGSQYSRVAAEAAIALAGQHHASIVGLGVVDVPHLTAPEAVPIGAGAFKVERDVALVDAADRKISSLLTDFQQDCDTVSVACSTLKLFGDPEKLLVHEAQGADLLVMGKKSIPEGPGRVASHVLRETLRHATRPVLCVCQSDARNWNNAPVLVAYDGSPQAAKALQIFHAVGLGRGRDVHLLMVTSDWRISVTPNSCHKARRSTVDAIIVPIAAIRHRIDSLFGPGGAAMQLVVSLV